MEMLISSNPEPLESRVLHTEVLPLERIFLHFELEDVEHYKERLLCSLEDIKYDAEITLASGYSAHRYLGLCNYMMGIDWESIPLALLIEHRMPHTKLFPFTWPSLPRPGLRIPEPHLDHHLTRVAPRLTWLEEEIRDIESILERYKAQQKDS